MTPPPSNEQSWNRSESLSRLATRARTRFAELVASGPVGLEATAVRALAILDASMPGRQYWQLPTEFLSMAAAQPDLGRTVCSLALSQADRRAEKPFVPSDVLREVEGAAGRLLAMHALPATDDIFQKDLSMSMLVSYPCVAQIVEQAGGIPLGLLVSGGVSQFVALSSYLVRTGKGQNYLQIHTHTPMLDGFTPAGWHRCFELTAQILAARPDCPGMLGASWFYDPRIAIVSPRLAYLSEMPMAGGAFRVRAGSSKKDVDLATATSATRRQLVDQGKYVPTCWAMIWPRERMLAWYSGLGTTK
jgi:hypothetical protein